MRTGSDTAESSTAEKSTAESSTAANDTDQAGSISVTVTM